MGNPMVPTKNVYVYTLKSTTKHICLRILDQFVCCEYEKNTQIQTIICYSICLVCIMLNSMLLKVSE